MTDLFRKPEVDWSDTDRATVLDIYKTLIEMSDRVSQRRQSANSFYLSVSTAVVGGGAYLRAVEGGMWVSLLVISLAGALISIIWIRNIESYKALNSAKFKVINAIEGALPISPYNAEWKQLDPHGTGRRHTPFHKIEALVPWVFIMAHVAQAAIAVPWTVLFTP